MSDHAKLLVAVSLSMMITSGLHYMLEQTARTHSFFQTIYLNYIRDFLLYTRCRYYEQGSDEQCDRLFTGENLFHGCIYVIIGSFLMGSVGRHRGSMLNHIRTLFLTLWTVEFLARFLASIDFIYKIDNLTVYLLIWQLTSTGMRFISQQLNSPLMIFEQGLFCVLAAIGSYGSYDAFGRYIPFQLNFIFYWLVSFIDILLCLHPNGWFRKLFDDSQTIESEETDMFNTNEAAGLMNHLKKLFIQHLESQFQGDRFPFLYYTHSADSDEPGCCLGAGDFLIYNTLLLLIIPPFSSIETRLCITLGCVISIIIGLFLTDTLGKILKQNIFPGVPLPVMIYSMYVLLLDIFSTSSSDCIGLSSECIRIGEESQID